MFLSAIVIAGLLAALALILGVYWMETHLPPEGDADVILVLGAQVKIDDSVEAGKLLIGDAKKITYNLVQDIMIETDRDIKKHVITHSGYARGEGALIDDKAFVLATVG